MELYYIIAVTDSDRGEAMNALFRETGLPMILSAPGRGTAKNEHLAVYGLDETLKTVTTSVASAQEAAQLVKSGMSIGLSGFTSVGYPKAVPSALAASGHAKDLTILVGAAVGDQIPLMQPAGRMHQALLLDQLERVAGEDSRPRCVCHHDIGRHSHSLMQVVIEPGHGPRRHYSLNIGKPPGPGQPE